MRRREWARTMNKEVMQCDTFAISRHRAVICLYGTESRLPRWQRRTSEVFTSNDTSISAIDMLSLSENSNGKHDSLSSPVNANNDSQ